MERNSYYFLSDKKHQIERFHICTWDLKNEKAFIEFGFEINLLESEEREITVHLVVPFLNNECEVISLHKNLSQALNGRFIFNDIITSVSPIEGDERNGAKLEFGNKSPLIIVPAKITQDLDNSVVCIKILKPMDTKQSLYCRILIKTKLETFAIVKKGISKALYLYDFKINEKRNLSDSVQKFISEKGLTYCQIRTVFCFHVVPDSFEVSFADSKKLVNIRKLENDAFKRYLPCIEALSKDNYIIIFNKSESKDGNESFSFFNSFIKEFIGSKQIFLAVGANILCTLLFAFSAYRTSIVANSVWYKEIPMEYILSLIVLVVFVILIILNKKK